MFLPSPSIARHELLYDATHILFCVFVDSLAVLFDKALALEIYPYVLFLLFQKKWHRQFKPVCIVYHKHVKHS